MEIKQLKLENFKGIKDLEINFSEETIISGKNATGKTTIFDAYSWLLWDKDSLNRKEFGIKPFTKDGNTKSNIESTVIGIIEVDGVDVNLRKTYKEIWTKKRGDIKETFSGHTTDYYINDVPIKKSEYNERVASIVDEKEFNLLSNPLYFNEILDKKERRSILTSLIKDVDKEDVIKENENLKKLDLDKYTLDEIKAMAKASRKKINDELKTLPARIDELEKSKNTYDFTQIEVNKKIVSEKIKEIDLSLSKSSETVDIITSKNKEIQDYLEEIRSMKAKIDDENYNLERKAEEDYQDKKGRFESEKASKERELKHLNSDLADKLKEKVSIEMFISRNNQTLDDLRNKWLDENEKEFDGSLDCPVCKRPLEDHDKKEILENFNQTKSKILEKIQNEAFELKATIDNKEERLIEVNKDIEKYELLIKDLEKEIENTKEFNEEKEEVVKLEYPK